MATPLDLTKTNPYLSLLLLEAQKGVAKKPEKELLDAIEAQLAITTGAAGSSAKSRRISSGSLTQGDLQVAFLHYADEKPPSWLAVPGTQFRDRVNQLIVVCRRKSLLAVHFSDSAAKSAVLKIISDGLEPSFKHYGTLSRAVLDAAFMNGGPARTLWLSGIHRRTAVKADTKVLSGTFLQRALNPLDDQSYHYTAARAVAKLGKGEKAVGVAHSKSSLWLSVTKSWAEFCMLVSQVFDALESAKPGTSTQGYQMPFLAEPVTNVQALGTPFDICFVPPELLSLGAGDDNKDQREEVEKWAYGCEFENVSDNKGALVADARLYDEPLGSVSLEITGKAGKLKVKATGTMDKNADPAQWSSFLKACENVRWLKVRYDSGTTLSDGGYYHMQFRDYPFDGWTFIDLGESGKNCYLPKQEKPMKGKAFDFTQIGNQKSLFCWVVNTWFGFKGFGSRTGFLFCDDGANEIADFIHLDLKPDDGKEPRLTLIHIKGSKTGGKNRSLSVSDYEIVCGQAVKNLRALEGVKLRDLAQAGVRKVIAEATWRDNKKVNDRKDLIKELDSLGSNYRRRVIIIQPRVTSTAHLKARALLDSGSTSVDANRFRQLNTLLLEAEMGCRSLGADFHVFGAKI